MEKLMHVLAEELRRAMYRTGAAWMRINWLAAVVDVDVAVHWRAHCLRMCLLVLMEWQ